jgi:hypothetical protein
MFLEREQYEKEQEIVLNRGNSSVISDLSQT